MNNKKKLGIVAAGAAGLLVACGSGDIVDVTKVDNMQMTMYSEDPTYLTSIVQDAINASCQTELDYQACVASKQPSGAASLISSSSVVAPTSSYAPVSTGSGTTQQGGTIQQGGSVNISSSPSQQSSPSVGSSASATPASSVTISTPSDADPNAWGTCAPNATNNAIKKGGSVQWKLDLDNSKAPGGASILTGGTFSWTFEGADKPSYAGTGMNFLNPTGISYANSGTFNASVTVSFGGQSNTIKCTPIEVTGAEVNNCKCTPSATEIDIAVSPAVTWTVDGCTSEEITYQYAWSDGFVGGASVSANLPKKGTYTPTVTVKNADNGMMNVTCGSVVAIDANDPDYVIKAPQIGGAVKVPAGKTTVQLEVTSTGNTVFCKVDRADSPTGAVSGSVNGSPIAGNDYATTTVAPGSLVSGSTLVFELDVAATCGIQ